MTTMPDQMYEYACQEGSYALSAVLSGARYQERLEAEEANDSRRDLQTRFSIDADGPMPEQGGL